MREVTVLLAGNPNVGKSTLFNALTGLRQHTGNWAGKTVETAEGHYTHKGRRYRLVDLPGTYSLDTRSREEGQARAVLEAGDFDCVAVVCDSTLLERNLILVYQLLALEVPVVLCLNLMDEARRRGIRVDVEGLSRRLEVPVVSLSAARGQGLEELREAIRQTAARGREPRSIALPANGRQRAALARETAETVTWGQRERSRGQRLDKILTGKYTGIPILLLLLFFLLWLTIAGANLPSRWLWQGVRWLHGLLSGPMASAPWWLRGALLDGMLLTTGRVVSVMLPPMGIFFPLFTLLEDLGYLPRMAYNLDHALEGCGGCGRMALTMGIGPLGAEKGRQAKAACRPGKRIIQRGSFPACRPPLRWGRWKPRSTRCRRPPCSTWCCSRHQRSWAWQT